MSANNVGRVLQRWDVVLELFEFGPAVVFAVGNANGCGAHIEVAMLMVATLRLVRVEV